MPLTFQDGAAFALTALFGILIWYYRFRARPLPYPPGPAGLPFVGNLQDIPPDPAWTTYRQWSSKYGSDVLRLNIFGKDIIIINSLAACTDLLERRSSNYSDRGDMVMLNELCGFNWNPGFQHYGDEWRQSRKVFHRTFGPESVKQFRQVMLDCTYELLRKLVSGTPDVITQLRLLAGTEIMKAACGIDVRSEDDPYIVMGERALQAGAATVNAGAYLVDILPLLKYIPSWFPGAQFQRDAKAWKHYVDRMKDEPWDYVKGRLAAGEQLDCAATHLLDALERNPNVGYTEQSIKHTLGAMYTGGADTSVSTLGSFFLAMVLYPEFQLNAQKEIDEVCLGGLPDFSLRDSLPYVDALVKESLRWHPVAPLVTPHRSIADDEYNGYLIPKGSKVIANAWAILHDENVYKDPHLFNPERFLKDGRIDPTVQDPSVACFGFGRRICPGRFLAYESMWIAVATTLASVTISRAKGPDGIPITPKGDYYEGFLCYPKAFQCEIRPRSAEYAALLESTAST